MMSRARTGFARGFTLIELLVVIAIIGILAAVVLASLSTARSKAQDTSVKAQMSNMRAASAIAYSNNGNSYNRTGNSIQSCDTSTASQIFSDTGSNMTALIKATSVLLGNASGVYTNMGCAIMNDGSAWAVWARLPSAIPGNLTGASYEWCVDDTGYVGNPVANYTVSTHVSCTNATLVAP